jgi:hypothetical protein
MPNLCPICGNHVRIEPTVPPGDAPCPSCGHLLWFIADERGDLHVFNATGDRDQRESLDFTPESAAIRLGRQLVRDFRYVKSRAGAILSELINPTM